MIVAICFWLSSLPDTHPPKFSLWCGMTWLYMQYVVYTEANIYAPKRDTYGCIFSLSVVKKSVK